MPLDGGGYRPFESAAKLTNHRVIWHQPRTTVNSITAGTFTVERGAGGKFSCVACNRVIRDPTSFRKHAAKCVDGVVAEEETEQAAQDLAYERAALGRRMDAALARQLADLPAVALDSAAVVAAEDPLERKTRMYAQLALLRTLVGVGDRACEGKERRAGSRGACSVDRL